VGTMIGMTSGFVGRWVDPVVMRFVDLLMAFPIFVLALFLMLVLGFGIQPVIFAIALVYVPNFARLARNTTLAVKEEPYVQAARLMGQSNLRIMLREILPNIAAPMFPSLGVVMADGKDYFLAHPWVITLTGLTLMVIILGLNLLGDGLRDILDPRLRKRSMA
jgi:peptide/nickel transport system permease protein